MRTDPRGVRSARLFAYGLFASLLALAGGCGGGTGDVSGKVTYKGKPVVYGTVTYVGSDGKPAAAQIAADGSYTISGVPVGEAKILVDSPKPATEQAAGRGTGMADRGGRPGSRGGAKDDPALPADAPRAADRERDTPNTVSPEIAAKWVALPDKYKDPTQTTLKYTVKKGANPHDVQLD